MGLYRQRPARLLLASAVISSLAPVAARAQDAAPSPKPAVALATSYRGVFVCEQAPGAPNILHVPVDLAVRNGEVQFARPLFNLNGTRVLGSELGHGTVDATGHIEMQSAWEFSTIVFQGKYAGALGQGSGTLTGKQSWRSPDGVAGSRTCQIAVVPTFNAMHTAGN